MCKGYLIIPQRASPYRQKEAPERIGWTLERGIMSFELSGAKDGVNIARGEFES
jgi:hypothetical protein